MASDDGLWEEHDSEANEVANMNRNWARIAMAVLWLAVSCGALAQGDRAPGPTTESEARVVRFASRLQLGIAVTGVAVYSPTLAELHLHAGQLASLLRGAQAQVRDLVSEGSDPALVDEAAAIATWATERFAEHESRAQILSAARNVQVYLDMAYETTQSILRSRKFQDATRGMYSLHAFLAAAMGPPGSPATLAGLTTLMRALDIEPSVAWGPATETTP